MSHESEPLDSLERDRHLLAACERFEEAWRGGSEPRIEEFLSESPEGLRPVLLRDLIAIEVELRRKRGERPSAADYEQRFPEQAGRLQDHSFQLSELTHPGKEAKESEPPRTIGRYKIGEPIGRGGFGMVYRAWDPALNRAVALKLLREGFGEPEWLDRFRREALVLAHLHHPNIVQIQDCGEGDGVTWLVMELVQGSTLGARLQHGPPLRPEEAAQLVETVARTVAYAHRQGVIHRDLKPSNILLAADGTPKVSDFGLAKRVQHEQHTMTGTLLGTPQYMAPEQTEDSRFVGSAADVWSLGVILYQCLTGRVPFAADSTFAILEQVRKSEPVSPRHLNPTVPRDLETICLKCLRKEPARRYGSAEALAEDLSRFRRSDPVIARRVGRVERAFRLIRRNPVTALVPIVLAVAGILTGFAFMGAYRTQQALAHEERVSEARLAVLQGRYAEAAELYDAAIADDYPDRGPLEEERFRYCLSSVVGAVTLVGLASDPSVGPLLAVPLVSESSLP